MDIIVAFVAGVVSFVSPCVLPLVPAYIGYMGGRMTHTVSAQVAMAGADGEVKTGVPFTTRFSTFMHGLAFVAGFTFVFVSLGVLGTAFFQQVGSTKTVEYMIGRIGGMLIILFGLHFMGAITAAFAIIRRNTWPQRYVALTGVALVGGLLAIFWGFTGTITPWNPPWNYKAWTGVLAGIMMLIFVLAMMIGGAFAYPAKFWNKLLDKIEFMFYADTRRQIDAKGDQGLSSSALMGVVFAAGWTPCIGPTLATAFMMAAPGGDLLHAIALMTAFSLGLGIPFLLTALMLDSAQGVLRKLKQRMHAITIVSGAFLVLIGFMITSGQLQSLSTKLSVQFNDLSYKLENCVVGLVDGSVSLGGFSECWDDDLGGGSDDTASRSEDIIFVSAGDDLTFMEVDHPHHPLSVIDS